MHLHTSHLQNNGYYLILNVLWTGIWINNNNQHNTQTAMLTTYMRKWGRELGHAVSVAECGIEKLVPVTPIKMWF